MVKYERGKKKKKISFITFDLSSFFFLKCIPIYKSVNVEYQYFNFNTMLKFFVKSYQNI